MEKLVGKSVFGGIAIGKISIFNKNDTKVKRIKIDDISLEKERFHKARNQAKTELKELYNKALKEVGETNAVLFEVHQMMLDDLDYIESVENIIKSQSVNAEYAVACTGDNFAKMFKAMDDEYMQARSADVLDISNRVTRILSGVTEGSIGGDEPAIVLAEDLTPSETVQMNKEKVLAFVTKYGSSNSHTAILARTMNIPALININYGDVNGKQAIVDGFSGILIIEPTEEVIEEYAKKRDEELKRRKLLLELKGKDNVTTDGRRIDVFANIGSVSDVAAVLKNDAGGIGLFRSEFLYLKNDDFPTEEEQFNAYKTVAENMAGKKVIIRTLDIGADKQVDYFGLPHEENPAMGYRAIRICLKQRDIFKTQLRAILRASVFGNISVMYPMIISVNEVVEIKKIMDEVKEELNVQGIPFKDIEQGVMIETPAAVMMSEEIGKLVDFFSIGTNDLTQYTLAIDRQNQMLDDFYDSHHPAILKMIKMVVENGHKSGCFVGICGELAGDYTLTKEFVDMGIDELSVSPGLVLGLRQTIRSI